ncbi:MAG: hypothetical protein HZA24_06780 [Nitrospirae bacterium]|nr:hypothetical protein [Nitrospirota bacterium]
MLNTKEMILLVAGTAGGVLSGIPVPQSIIQGASLGFLIALGIILGQREIDRRGLHGRGAKVRAKWLTLTGAAWGAVIGALTAAGPLAFEYGVYSQAFGFHYPRTNTFGQTIHGVLPGTITGICVAVAMGLAFTMVKEEEKMWFMIPFAIPLGWWTGAESLAVGQSLGHLNWDYMGPAQVQGMRFGIPWMECMIIFRWAYLAATGDLRRMRAAIKAADDAKWAAAESAPAAQAGSSRSS